ncbi:hypothetical protein [Nocardia asteroides]|uniref:hypothetical protein n=1 Tax=Nocardia asteroides TaxID=1824 RepID=UPI001E4AC8AD|nr:hypothetical protein [Nocardia asteroides]UGT63813.1 hypothetical protein LTT61_11120 [Nocardia asteroides]
MLEFAMLLIMAATLVALVVLYRRGRRGVPIAEPERGSLHITGVSPRPEAFGEQFVTVTGDLTGPGVASTQVYRRLVWDGAYWPAIGDTLPVIYPAGKPDRWQIIEPG